MGKRKKAGIFCAAIALAGIIAGILLWNNRIERQFPLWKTPCLEVDNSRTDPNVELRFEGIEHGVTLQNGELCDQVTVNLKGISGQGISYNDLAWVDYFYNGEWHTVWENGLTVLSSRIINGSDVREGEIPIRKSVSPGLFAREGQYRILIDGLGYCEIEIP